MKKLIFILSIIVLACNFAFSQNQPAQVPTSYLNTHCFIRNYETSAVYFSSSIDKINWKEEKLPGHATIDLPLVDSIYLKIFSTRTNFSIITAYPAKYYKISYDHSLKKWIIQ
ncbi:hypothetical protein [Mucilaginibacter sp.]|uniref:hypothetical protein n=1 Tax=Mucilaginibacter sp. TaxID=1882438 RepID=UPI00261ABD3F|nr:hypothetical protein [Mucilaginibacter sp.]MDB4919510.1 hypothetical protein [Mucilaginibacter sp.]